ncbi:MAG: 50S ribosomal protein L24 [Oscillospiraceae bacterium]|nr:50S ribosomal protein L24 [Oscillospiraceae bacterium]
MADKLHIKSGDRVVVISGKNKGKKGKIMETSPKEGKVIIEGVNVATKHVKPRKMGQQGGLIKVEAPLYACKVMLLCPKCNKPTRAAKGMDGNEKKRRCTKKDCAALF